METRALGIDGEFTGASERVDEALDVGVRVEIGGRRWGCQRNALLGRSSRG
jgi:hypothetical protein